MTLTTRDCNSEGEAILCFFTRVQRHTRYRLQSVLIVCKCLVKVKGSETNEIIFCSSTANNTASWVPSYIEIHNDSCSKEVSVRFQLAPENYQFAEYTVQLVESGTDHLINSADLSIRLEV